MCGGCRLPDLADEVSAAAPPAVGSPGGDRFGVTEALVLPPRMFVSNVLFMLAQEELKLGKPIEDKVWSLGSIRSAAAC